MRKIWIVLCVVLLTACTTEEPELREKISTEMSTNVESFEVNEKFMLKQTGRNNNEPHNISIQIDNKILYDSEVIVTINAMREDKSYLGEQSVRTSNFKSYKNWFSDYGYVKDENSDWYEVGLPMMFDDIGMGSIDPLDIINTILYENTMYQEMKDQDNLNGEENYIMTEISSELFEKMFVSSVFRFLDMNNPYDISAVIKVNEDDRVEYIDFDLSDLEDLYIDHYHYEIESVSNLLNASLRLEFSNYNQVRNSFGEETIDWVLDDDYEIFMDDVDDYIMESDLGDATATIEYIDNKYKVNVNVDLLKEIKYLYYEIYLYAGDELIESDWNESFDGNAFELISIYETTCKEKIDKIYFKTRYVTADSTSIRLEQTIVPYTYDEPPHQLDLDIRKFIEKPKDIVPNVIIEHKTWENEEKVYDIFVDLYSIENVRHANVNLYLYKDDEVVKVIYKNDLDMVEGEHITFSKEINFMPDTIYAEITYNLSSLVTESNTINLHFKVLDGAFENDEFESGEFVNINVSEVYDPKWFAYKYFFQMDFLEEIKDFNAYIYFLDDDDNLIGWKYIYIIATVEDYTTIEGYDEYI